MADPLRRTLLAKLRGKKSKKGTTAGGYGAAANGGREGKEKVLHEREPQTQPVAMLSELCREAEKIGGNKSFSDGVSELKDRLVLDSSVVVESALPQREAATMHINTSRGNNQGSAGSGFRARVNEELLGVSLQREMQSGVNDRDETGRIHKHGPYLMEQVPPGPHAQIKHFVTMPRQYSGGDSIGFGSSQSHILYPRSDANRVVELTDGQHPALKNSGTNVCIDKDPKTPSDGADPCLQFMFNAEHVVSLNDRKEKVNDHPDCNGLLDTNVTTNRTKMYLPSFPCTYRPASSYTEENILIRNIESYGSSAQYSVDARVPNLQSPTYFPTELEICEINMSSLCTRDGSIRHYSLDSEDDDYYDNEILPFYETERALANDRKTSDKLAPELTQSGTGEQHLTNSSQETDRLRSQLKEAYYLLINAMHDISFDGPVVVSGFLDQTSSSSHSQDSLCSRSSAKHVDSDSWSSGEHSPQGSDTDSLMLSKSHEPCLKNRLNSQSLVSLSASNTRPPLLRSASDGAIKYPDGPCVKAFALRSLEAGVGGDGTARPVRVSELLDSAGSDDPLQEEARLRGSSGSANSLTGSSDNSPDALGSGPGANGGGGGVAAGDSAKAHGVTVNKMQEWMHKGRLLSSEMKQRIQGPSPRPPAAPGGVKASAAPLSPSHSALQSALIENVHSSYSNGCELAGGKAIDPSPWRPPHNNITVSKKRNWLQQSSGKPHASDDVQGPPGAEEDGGPAPRPPPSPSPENLRLLRPPPSRPLRLNLPQVSVGHARVAPQPRRVDPTEENDADDEGEIWYNPIPEDDEPEQTTRPPARLQVPATADPQRRPSRGGEAGRTQEGCSVSGLESVGEGLGGGGGGDGSQGNAVHSMEIQLHRQTLACKPQEEGPPGRATDIPDTPNSGFSPPSSPNPTKKGSSINWSFPDKIKSPRTVRKLSMKMKKLPELSRKLSVKGTPSNSSGNGGTSSHSETRVHCPKPGNRSEPARAPSRLFSGAGQAAAASRNVISRYHLDSSVSTQHSYSKKKSNGASKSASKGGYLSDGDSPELVAKSGKHGPTEGKAGKSKEPVSAGGERPGGGGVGGGSPKLHGTELDIDAFRHYSFSEQPKCTQYISGLMSLHFYGAEDLKPPRVDSRDVYCAIQVDSVNKARTALLTCRTAFLGMDHTFNIELENAQHLKLVVFSWEPTPKKNRVCCHGTVSLPALFRVTRSHQLAVKLEPRGLIYVKLNLMEQWQNSLDGGPDRDREPQVFGVEAWRVVEKEASGLSVPLLINKSITEIEKRGCQVVGLYRLCGSAAVKKELREAFERDSHGVELGENTYPDINVITGVLKDYLRELPYPLITKHLYEAVLDSIARRPLRIGPGGCENDQGDTEHTVSLLENLPEVERVTLRKLLNHLKLVASHHEVNKMTCQNLAVCFGPVLLSQRQEAHCHSNRVFIDSEELASALHFKKHIEVLHYLLQLWPVVDPHGKTSSPTPEPPAQAGPLSAPPLRRRKERPQVLNLSEAEMAGVLRPRPGRLDSPSNRYAGDWSCCGEGYFPPAAAPRDEADYDDVPSEDMEVAEDGGQDGGPDGGEESPQGGPEVAAGPDEPPPGVEAMEGGVEEEKAEEEVEQDEGEEEGESDGSAGRDTACDQDHILPPCTAREHAYQAYMKIQDNPVLSHRVNLRDLQESIDTLIGNLERELNKNKLNAGY
ncbi:rho GTPase-activating protein SYDE2 isoform X1 [Osmerus eperlanus]|uniref:rho GTPase-activating protein SYDE2 isoform X1 n=1 Tax=Osmerus eperlanus TaxID=29151 RepID=UPI002E0ECADC